MELRGVRLAAAAAENQKPGLLPRREVLPARASQR
jgi:hypothetical protein